MSAGGVSPPALRRRCRDIVRTLLRSAGLSHDARTGGARNGLPRRRSVGSVAALTAALLLAGPAAGCGARAANVSWTSANGSLASQRAATATELDARTIPRLEVRWRFRLHSTGTGFGAITSNPIIRGDVVYLQDSTSSVYALDVRSGALLWKDSLEGAERRPERPLALGFAAVRCNRHDGLRARRDDRQTALVAVSRQPFRAVRRDRAGRRPWSGVRQHPGVRAGRPWRALCTVCRDGQDRLALPDDQAAVEASSRQRRRRRLESGERRRARQRLRGYLEPGSVGWVERVPERRRLPGARRSTPTHSSCSMERRAVCAGTTR